jgi:hypothetical protein
MAAPSAWQQVMGATLPSFDCILKCFLKACKKLRLLMGRALHFKSWHKKDSAK